MTQHIFSINGAEMSLGTEGSGSATLVFMAGSGVTSPIIEYKKLYSKFSTAYTIAVIEKHGYGYSAGNTGLSRDIEALVSEDRALPEAAGIKPPYALVPHSYSGIEALYWAKCFPNEVKAILGLDMVTTDMALAQAEAISEEKKADMLQKQSKMLLKLKKSKLMQGLFKNKLENASGIMTDSFFSDEDKAEYRRLFYANLTNSEITDEQTAATENARKTDVLGAPECAGCMFITDMKNPMAKELSWREKNTEYAKKAGFEYHHADTTHFLYNTITDEIYEEWSRFLGKML